jgi:tetratricopeptide (TPR) repeat protein
MINKFEEAISYYLLALDQNEKSPECHFNLASAYNDVKHQDRAVKHYKRAIELDENNIDAYICLGGVYEALG